MASEMIFRLKIPFRRLVFVEERHRLEEAFNESFFTATFGTSIICIFICLLFEYCYLIFQFRAVFVNFV